MNTRFNNNQGLQATPKICRKGPEGWKYFDFFFPDYPLQAFASWQDPFTPLDATISGTAILDPFPASDLHFGIIQGDPNHLELDLIYNAAMQSFSLVIQLMLGATILDSVSAAWSEPSPVVPWKSEYFTWKPPAKSYLVECKIYS